MYTNIDKFGHCSSSNSENDSENIKLVLRNALGLNLDEKKNLSLQMKRIINVGLPIDDNDVITKDFFFTNLNRVQNKLETRIREINGMIQDNIRTDVELIESVIDERINSTYKESMTEIYDYLKIIDNYLQKYVVAKKQLSDDDDDVKILKIIYPKIKG